MTTEQQQRRKALDRVAIAATMNLKKYREEQEEVLKGTLYKTAKVIKNNFLTAVRNGKSRGYSFETSTALIAVQRKQSRAAVRRQVKKLLEIGFLTNYEIKGAGSWATNYYLTINPQALGDVFSSPDTIKSVSNPHCYDSEDQRIRSEVNRAAYTAALLLARYADNLNANIPYEDRADRLRGGLADTAQIILTMLFTAAKTGDNNGYSFDTNTDEIAKEKGQSRRTVIRHINRLVEMGVLERGAETKTAKQLYSITFNKEIIRDVLADVDFSKQLAEQPQNTPVEGQEAQDEQSVTLDIRKPVRPANDGFDDTAEGWRSYLDDLFSSLEKPSKISEKPPDTG